MRAPAGTDLRVGGLCFDGVVKLLAPSLAASPAHDLPELDESQRRVVEAVASEHRDVVVSGAPGSGKTRLAVELVRDAIERGVDPRRIVVLAATRKGAGTLRDVVTRSVAVPVQGSAVRTPAALAFSILTARAASLGQGVPRLITGGEQDQILASILQGYSDGYLKGPAWPPSIPEETLGLRGFRAELRDLLMRAAENGLDADGLAECGTRFGRPEWVAAASILRDYSDVTSLSTIVSDAGRRYDPAQIVEEAARELAVWTGAGRPSFDLVIIDDYQEATAATARLLSVLKSDGAQLVLIGDPDVAVQGFRGARPTLLAAAGAEPPAGGISSPQSLGQFGAREMTLDCVWRGVRAGGESGFEGLRDSGGQCAAEDLRSAVRAVTVSIASAGLVRHRAAGAGSHLVDPAEADTDGEGFGEARAAKAGAETNRAGDAVRVRVFPTEALEAAHVARELRAEHLRNGVPWSDMAVICRSGADLLRMRRELASSGVPVAVVGTDVPLRDEPAVRPLLLALRSASGELDIDVAVDLLSSVIGGADPIALRRIRHALRAEELRGGGGRNSDALIVDALQDPARSTTLGAVGAPLARVARALAAGRAALAEPGATPQTVLWAVWDATKLADLWQRSALMGGAGSERADRDLDAVMSLFRAAETFVDRLPEADTSSFLEFIESQDIPADSLVQQVALGGKVSLLTPAGAAGSEWPLVVVAGVQDGVWPDLRLRDSLLGAATLAEVLSGRSRDARGLGKEARREVYYDELRSFALAVSRASRRLIVTAVEDTETVPSSFLTLLDPNAGLVSEGEAEVSATDPAAQSLDLRGLVTVLRAEMIVGLEQNDRELTLSRAQLLSYFASVGVSDAHVRNWYGAAPVSSTEPLYADSEKVSISPSKVESVGRCALRWSLESAGGSPRSGLSQSVGTLVHAIAADFPQGTFHELAQELDRRWHELGLPDGWPSRRQRELARGMVEKLAQYYSTKVPADLSRVLVEQEFRVDVAGATLAGIVDRLEVTHDGYAKVVDLKTGKNVPSGDKAKENPQLGIYQLALLSGAFEGVSHSLGAELVYVGKQSQSVTTRSQPPLEDATDNWATKLVEDSVQVMRSSTFAGVVNELCQVCPVRRSCPLNSEGQHVVSLGMPVPRPCSDDDPATGATSPEAHDTASTSPADKESENA